MIRLMLSNILHLSTGLKKTAQMLIEKGANVNAATDENVTSLIFASTNGMIPIKNYIEHVRSTSSYVVKAQVWLIKDINLFE